MTMAHARAVMKLPLKVKDPNFAKILAAKQAIASSVLVATTRVRANALRPMNDDGLGELLDKIKKGGTEVVRTEDLFA